MRVSEVTGQSLNQFVELGLAFLLSALVGWSARFATKARDFAPIRS